MDQMNERLRAFTTDVSLQVKENREVAIGVGAVIAAYGAYKAFGSNSSHYKSRPGSFNLTGGSIARNEIGTTFNDYSAAYGGNAGDGIKDRSKTTALVNTFYNLVTDIYEWGWGTSFHFSPRLPGKSVGASEAAHESRIAAVLDAQPGYNVLDVGCGVGGPMRTIASTSGAHVTGVTINDYQVSRATYHNQKLGLSELCEAVEGDFLNIPFPEGTFDAAYAIEATCHAAKLEEVYGQVFKALKPGCLFASYEWVATKSFDSSNPQHVKIIDDINFGNGLPEMRTWTQAEAAGKAVGFELVTSRDIATVSPLCGPWYDRLRTGMSGRTMQRINHAIVSTLSFLHLAPKGVKEVHGMLVEVARSLVEGGESGIFTPMHLLVFKKPGSPSSNDGSNISS